MAAEFMLGLKPVAIVIFVGVADVEPADAAGLAELVAANVAAGVPLVGDALGDELGLAPEDVVVSVDGRVADVEEPQAEATMLTQSSIAINTDRRIFSPFIFGFRLYAPGMPDAEYHRLNEAFVSESASNFVAELIFEALDTCWDRCVTCDRDVTRRRSSSRASSFDAEGLPPLSAPRSL
jgi:hypothetical protein